MLGLEPLTSHASRSEVNDLNATEAVAAEHPESGCEPEVRTNLRRGATGERCGYDCACGAIVGGAHRGRGLNR